MKKRALVSVSDKTGVVEFVKGLLEQGIEVISTGGTKKLLEENGLQVIGISEVTGFPEIMDGRVKTLHPNIHGGLLAVRDNETHVTQMNELGMEPIDFVVVNLYPFKETIAKPDVTFADAIENIDIGGPTMIRSAAKNHKFVSVIVDPVDYDIVLAELKENGEVAEETKRKLAAKVFRHTAAYDALISNYLTEQMGEESPETLTVTFEKKQDLRYGENPHQRQLSIKRHSQQLLLLHTQNNYTVRVSYNNINDADAALSIVKEFTEPAVVAVKHMNPCGVGVGTDIHEAYTALMKQISINFRRYYCSKS